MPFNANANKKSGYWGKSINRLQWRKDPPAEQNIYEYLTHSFIQLRMRTPITLYICIYIFYFHDIYINVYKSLIC